MRILVLAILAALAVSCTAPGGDAGARTLKPDRQEGATDFRVKLLAPERPEAAAQGRQSLAFLLYDGRDGSPVEDATVFVESWMADHDHAGEEESDPLHTGDGIYRGETLHSMAGNWDVRLEGVREGGDAFWMTLRFKVE